jgi:hypothetical protein
MKKLITTMMQRTLNKQDGRLTIGLDLGDRSSFYCVSEERSLHLRRSSHTFCFLWIFTHRYKPRYKPRYIRRLAAHRERAVS